MTSHFTGTTRKQKMESRKAASEEVRLQTTAKNRKTPNGSINLGEKKNKQQKKHNK